MTHSFRATCIGNGCLWRLYRLNALYSGPTNVYNTYNVPDVETVGQKALQILQTQAATYLSNLYFQRVRSMLKCLSQLGADAEKEASTQSTSELPKSVLSVSDQARVSIGVALHLQACYVIDNYVSQSTRNEHGNQDRSFGLGNSRHKVGFSPRAVVSKPVPQRIEVFLLSPTGQYEQALSKCFELFSLDFNKWMDEN